jgi:hypothetical protein
MAIIVDEVIADVSTPIREVTAETPSAEDPDHSQQIVKDVLKTLERKKFREQRLKAD